MPPDPKRPWFESVTALLMAFGSLSTAWCSFQSSRWSGQSTELATRADRLERHAMAQHFEGQEIMALQAHMVMEAIDAQIAGNEKLSRFYTDRFAGELAPAYKKWLELEPFENPAAPPHPFVPGLYTPRYAQEIRNAQADAERTDEGSRLDGHYASSYLGYTVTFASVLFFAGTAGKFDQRRVRWWSLVFAITLFLYSVVGMFLLPVA